MTGQAVQIIAALWAATELVVLVWAGTGLSLECGLTVAEAVVYGAMGTMMALSLIYQVTYQAALPAAGYLLEAALVAVAAVYLSRRAGRSPGVAAAFANTARHSPAALAGLALTAAWLVWKAMSLSPDDGQWAYLQPVLDMETQGRLAGAGAFFNHRILCHLLLRWHTPFGLGLFGLLAYGVVGAGTYALARRYAWPETALTAAMVVFSAPRLVSQAATPGMELVPAAAAVFSLVALYRTVELPTAGDLVVLCLAIAFTVSDNPMGAAWPPILAGLSAVVLFRRHGSRIWWRLIAERPRLALMAAVPLCVFSQVFQWVGAAGANAVDLQNADGIIGSAANLARYFLESLRAGPDIDRLCLRLIQISPAALIDGVYALAVLPWSGMRGAAAPFTAAASAGPAGGGFGPLWVLIVLPAWMVALVRGPRRLKAVAVALAGYAYLVCLIPAWMPGGARLFTVFFSVAGFMTAYLLPPWHFTTRRRRFVQFCCLALMVYAGATVP